MIRKILFLYLLSGILTVTALLLIAAEPSELDMLLSEGQELFQQASNTADEENARILYQKALYRFQTIVERGQVNNGKLFYNMGNTYYRLGDIGRAILFYRRAQLIIPADPNLKHNLRYVRSQRKDLVPTRQDSLVLRTLFFWHSSSPPRVKLSIFITFFWGACLLAVLTLLQANRNKRWKRAFLAFCSGIALLMLISLITDEIRLRTLKDGVITTEEVVARKGDGIAYQRSFVEPLHQGTEFTLLEERAGWYYIELSDGRTGWIPASAAEMVIQGMRGV